MSLHRNRVQMTVTGAPGTGTITLNAATSGYQSFSSAYGADATVDILITEGNNWEVCRNCAYTNGTPQVDRGTLEGSSAGPTTRVSFGSGAIVSVIATAGFGNDIESTFQSLTPGGRLTLESGVPVSTTDQTSKTTIYYTPYVHNVISLWNGSNWVPTPFTETSLALGTLTSGRPYDVFGYLSSGALALELLSWTSDTARATAITLQDGRYCKSGDKTRLYLGTFYTTSTTTTEDSAVKRFVSNMYNRVQKRLFYDSPAGSHTYNSTTFRQWDANSAAQVEIVNGLQSDNILVGAGALTTAPSSAIARVGIGENSTSSIQAYTLWDNAVASPQRAAGAMHSVVPRLGHSYFAMLEAISPSGTGTFEAGRISGAWQC